ncbi:MAG: dihydroneopterin aldolase [Aeromonadaceae bacterium]
MDKVFVSGLEVMCTIGAYDWEKGIQQKLIFDLEMAFDNRPAAACDDLALALDYARVSQSVITLVQSAPHELVETVAERVAALILRDFAVPRVKVRVTKPHAVLAARGGVGVEIIREA